MTLWECGGFSAAFPGSCRSGSRASARYLAAVPRPPSFDYAQQPSSFDQAQDDGCGAAQDDGRGTDLWQPRLAGSFDPLRMTRSLSCSTSHESQPPNPSSSGAQSGDESPHSHTNSNRPELLLSAPRAAAAPRLPPGLAPAVDFDDSDLLERFSLFGGR